jgi:hypothetical protein
MPWAASASEGAEARSQFVTVLAEQALEEYLVHVAVLARLVQRVAQPVAVLVVEVECDGAEMEIEIHHRRRAPVDARKRRRHVVAYRARADAALGAHEGYRPSPGAGLVGAEHRLHRAHQGRKGEGAKQVFADAHVEDVAVEVNSVHRPDDDELRARGHDAGQPFEILL